MVLAQYNPSTSRLSWNTATSKLQVSTTGGDVPFTGCSSCFTNATVADTLRLVFTGTHIYSSVGCEYYVGHECPGYPGTPSGFTKNATAAFNDTFDIPLVINQYDIVRWDAVYEDYFTADFYRVTGGDPCVADFCGTLPWYQYNDLGVRVQLSVATCTLSVRVYQKFESFGDIGPWFTASGWTPVPQTCVNTVGVLFNDIGSVGGEVTITEL